MRAYKRVYYLGTAIHLLEGQQITQIVDIARNIHFNGMFLLK